jgi:hypothetical protein
MANFRPDAAVKYTATILTDENSVDIHPVGNPGGAVKPFTVSGGVVYLNKARIKDADIDTLKLDGIAVTIPITVNSTKKYGKWPSPADPNDYIPADFSQIGENWKGLGPNTPHAPVSPSPAGNTYSLLTYGKLYMDQIGILYAHWIGSVSYQGNGRDFAFQFVMVLKNNAGDVVWVDKVKAYNNDVQSPVMAVSRKLGVGWATIEVWWRAEDKTICDKSVLFMMGGKR